MTSAGSLTSTIDNAQVDPALVATAQATFSREITTWQRAGAKDQALFHAREGLNGLADNLYALTRLDGMDFWVLENGWSGFPDPSQYILLGLHGNGTVSALAYFEDWPDTWTQPTTSRRRDPKQSLLEMAHKAAKTPQSGPTSSKQLAAAGGMAFLKGGAVSAIIVAPFFGIAAAILAATAFSAFCIGLALWRNPKTEHST